MKKRYKALIVLASLFVMIFTLLFCFYMGDWNKLNRIIGPETRSFNWGLKGSWVNVMNKKIIVEFRLKTGNPPSKKINDIKGITETVANVLLYNENSEYSDYTIDIVFLDVGDIFRIDNINNQSRPVQVNTNIFIPVETIARFFPNTDELHLNSAHFDSISEIQGFTSLKVLHFSQGVSDDERAYILSLFPDCIIEEPSVN